MRIDYIPITEIEFQRCPYDKALYNSLKRAGLNFPIRVHKSMFGYVCKDGNKRLSAITDILKEDAIQTKFQNIPIILEEQARTSAPYSMHNHH